MAYKARVGGYKWNASLAEVLQHSRDISNGLEKLKRVAENQETELFIYELMVKALRNVDMLHELQGMDDRSLMEPTHNEPARGQDREDNDLSV